MKGDNVSKYEEYEGAVNVNGDITPISRKKIENLDSMKWPDMSISELTDQRIILNNRIMQASASGNLGIVQQLKRGLFYLDELMVEKSSRDEDIHLV